jgi:hypothetical protein
MFSDGRRASRRIDAIIDRILPPLLRTESDEIRSDLTGKPESGVLPGVTVGMSQAGAIPSGWGWKPGVS